MSHDRKNQPFHFTLNHLIRLIIFVGLVYFLINYLSTQTSPVIDDPTVLGDEVNSSVLVDGAYQLLPEKSRREIDNLPNNPVIISLQQKYQQLLAETNGFPQKQIDDFKSWLIRNLAQQLINSIDNQ